MDSPSYYAIIPASVRYDERLQPLARMLYGEITALANKEGYCFASNSYFAKLYKVEPNTISTWISRLETCGHIMSRIDKKNGNERRIYILDKNMQEVMNRGMEEEATPITNNRDTYPENSVHPITKNREHNNTVNSTSNSSNKAPDELFENETTKKTLFRNSAVADFKVFQSQFTDWEGLQVDIAYYYHSVADWSESANKLRTARGWIATARTFMRGDHAKGKLVKLNTNKATKTDEMLTFLKS